MIQEQDIHSEGSVQRMYRPVVYMKKIPDIPPNDKNNKGYQWWAEQLYRCQHGWTAPNGKYINPYLYFFMNFVKIRPLTQETIGKSEVISPYYRDNDDDITSIIWNNTRKETPLGVTNAMNHVEAKPRGIAWTTLSLFGVGLWTFIFRSDWPIGSAYPLDKYRNKERLSFIQAWGDLHPIFRRWKGRNLEILNNSEEEFRIGWKISGKQVHSHNIALWHVVSSDKAGIYRGDRMNLMMAVEAGLWEGNSLKNYVTENEPCIMLGTDAWGMTLVGGTSDMINNASTAYRDIFESNEAYRASRHFTPVTKVLYGCINYYTGQSEVEKAYKIIMDRRAMYEGDADRYARELVENPIRWEEAFVPNIQFAYNARAINEQLQFIRFNQLDQLWVKGELYYAEDINGKPTTEVRFRANEDGMWMINMECQPNFKYEGLDVAGIDDTFKGLDPRIRRKKDASQNAMVIYRRRCETFPGKTDLPAAIFFGHSPEMGVIYEEFLKGIRFYNIKYTLYEYHHDAFVNFLNLEGEGSRLYYVDGKPGVAPDKSMKAEQTLLGSKYFREGRYRKNTSTQIMEALNVWGSKENTDIGSAIHLIFQILEFVKDQPVELSEKVYERNSSYIILSAQEEGQNRKENAKSNYIILPGRRSA